MTRRERANRPNEGGTERERERGHRDREVERRALGRRDTSLGLRPNKLHDVHLSYPLSLMRQPAAEMINSGREDAERGIRHLDAVCVSIYVCMTASRCRRAADDVLHRTPVFRGVLILSFLL